MLGISETNFTNLWMLILISCFALILPLPLLNYVQFDEAVKQTEEVCKAEDFQKALEENERKSYTLDSVGGNSSSPIIETKA